MKLCNHCKQLKRPDEMSAGKGHCKLCRNAQQNTERKERLERIAAKGVAAPRTHVSTAPLEPERTYYRNNGLKHIPSRGMPT